eukprot:575800-Prymnesium_polylepis.1
MSTVVVGARWYCIIAVSVLAYSYLRHGHHLLVVYCPDPPRPLARLAPSCPFARLILHGTC